jgi:hypothetical protein
VTPAAPSYRFSGHESFACRYAWLPKAYRALQRDSLIFSDEPRAMVELGLGKNMVRSLRFWVEVAGLAEPNRTRGLDTTDFAHALLGERGLDPFLEDQRTLWLLHWKLASREESPLFAWHFLFNHWPFPELTRSEAIAAFQRESERLGSGHSPVTLGQHLDVFLHTYHRSRHAKASLEDSLDGPLVELGLLYPIGERRSGAGRFETVFAFRRGPKPEIGPALFDYCVDDYWRRFHPQEASLTLRDIALAPGSPGQVFQLSEEDVRARLEASSSTYRAPYTYQPSAVQGMLFRTDADMMLSHVFEAELLDA